MPLGINSESIVENFQQRADTLLNIRYDDDIFDFFDILQRYRKTSNDKE